MLLQYYTGLRNFFWCTTAVKIEHRPEYAVAILHRFARFLWRTVVVKNCTDRNMLLKYYAGFLNFYGAQQQWKITYRSKYAIVILGHSPQFFFSMHGNREKLHMGRHIPSWTLCPFLWIFRCILAVKMTYPVTIHSPVNDWLFYRYQLIYL